MKNPFVKEQKGMDLFKGRNFVPLKTALILANGYVTPFCLRLKMRKKRKMKIFKELLEKLTEFDELDYPKPDFGKEISDLFIPILKNYKSLTVEINNIEEGAYFGKQCVVSFYDSPFCEKCVEVEIAWDSSRISIYTSKHEGYWVAPYTTEAELLPVWIEFLKDFLF